MGSDWLRRCFIVAVGVWRKEGGKGEFYYSVEPLVKCLAMGVVNVYGYESKGGG
jgi:hypothetical protein